MKERLDISMVKRGLAPTREKAKAVIMTGQVFVNNERADKSGLGITEEDEIEVRGKLNPFVSRGGLKLQKAIETFGIDLVGKTAMDIGASTGGFTDCMLQNGASKVFAVDVGYGQLAWKLRQDEKVVSMERTNIRYVTPEMIGEQLDFASIDVSFISLKLVLPVAQRLLKDDGAILALIKPQFEAGREKVGKKGVVRDEKVHLEVLEKVLGFCHELSLYPQKLDFSPIRGPEGNIEYLIYLKKNPCEWGNNAEEVVAASHASL